VNLDEYIASGILEAYALGDLAPAERAEVQANLAKHTSLRKELLQIELAMEQLVAKAGASPRKQLKERILASIEGNTRKGRIVQFQSTTVTAWKYATAASLIVAVASSVLAFMFWINWKRTESDLNERIELTGRMAEEYNSVNQRLDKIEDDLQIYDNPAFNKVVLNGTNHAPEAMATIYWNQSTADVYISLQNMKSLSRDNQYQLWAIVDGKPIDMGMFDGEIAGLIKMKSVKNASAFAVTIESRGGRPVPTIGTMQVMGRT
jgi:anti-sigma-K factor RskA